MHGQLNIKISMMLAINELLCYAAIAVVLDRKYRRNARKSREWTKKWLLKWQDFSHVNLLKELRFHPKDWHNFLKMNESTYLTLLSTVSTVCLFVCLRVMTLLQSNAEIWVLRLLLGSNFEVIWRSCATAWLAMWSNYEVSLTVHLSIILVNDQLNAQILVLQWVYFMLLHVSRTM